jgi:hypothetical protein
MWPLAKSASLNGRTPKLRMLESIFRMGPRFETLFFAPETAGAINALIDRDPLQHQYVRPLTTAFGVARSVA